MKKILIVMVESTLLTLFFTLMSQASILTQSSMSCRSSLSNMHRCAKVVSVASAEHVKFGLGRAESFRR
jgi:hypothetical protein